MSKNNFTKSPLIEMIFIILYFFGVLLFGSWAIDSGNIYAYLLTLTCVYFLLGKTINLIRKKTKGLKNNEQ